MEVKVEVKNAQIDYAKAHLVFGFCFGSVILEVMIRKIHGRLQGRQEQPACNGGVASKKIVLPSQVCHDAMIVIPCFMYLYERAVQDMSCLKVPPQNSKGNIMFSSLISFEIMCNAVPQHGQISTTCTPFPNLPVPSNIIAAFTKTVLCPPNRPPQTLSQTTAFTP